MGPDTKWYSVEIAQHSVIIFSCDKNKKVWNMQENATDK